MGQGNDAFAPWRVDYWWGIVWFVCGMSGSWLLVAGGHAFMAFGVGFWGAARGWRRVFWGLARERGIEVERRSVERLLASVDTGVCGVRSDVRMMRAGICCGNIDVVVSPEWTRARFVIEIKSYPGIERRWYGLCRKDKNYRLWSPQKQVKGQCGYLGRRWHFPVLWLPESDLNNWFIHDDMLVVNGGTGVLWDGLRQFDQVVQLPVRVIFPRPPGVSFTGGMRSRRFVYDGANWWWNGVSSKRGVGELANFVSGADGKVSWLIE